MFDVYLGGYADIIWRGEFKGKISRDISIFDPFETTYLTFDENEKANQIAKELEYIENSEVIVFYMCPEWNSLYSMTQLGDAVGQGKQVVVCLEGDVESEEKIRRYCEYKGIPIVENIDDLVENVEECIGQMEMLKSMETL